MKASSFLHLILYFENRTTFCNSFQESYFSLCAYSKNSVLRKFISNIVCIYIKYPNIISPSRALNVIWLQHSEVTWKGQVLQRQMKDNKSSYKKRFINIHTDDGISFILTEFHLFFSPTVQMATHFPFRRWASWFYLCPSVVSLGQADASLGFPAGTEVPGYPIHAMNRPSAALSSGYVTSTSVPVDIGAVLRTC